MIIKIYESKKHAMTVQQPVTDRCNMIIHIVCIASFFYHFKNTQNSLERDSSSRECPDIYIQYSPGESHLLSPDNSTSFYKTNSTFSVFCTTHLILYSIGNIRYNIPGYVR